MDTEKMKAYRLHLHRLEIADTYDVIDSRFRVTRYGVNLLFVFDILGAIPIIGAVSSSLRMIKTIYVVNVQDCNKQLGNFQMLMIGRTILEIAMSIFYLQGEMTANDMAVLQGSMVFLCMFGEFGDVGRVIYADLLSEQTT